MLNKLDYSYNNENSFIHKINPSIKLLGLFFYVLFCLLKYNNYLFICNITLVFILMLFSNVDYKRYLKVISKWIFLLIFLYVFLYSKEMVIRDINIIIFKILFFVLYFKCLLFTTTREEFGKGGSVLLNLFNLIGLSLRRIGINISNIFSFIYYFIDTCKDYFINISIKGGCADLSIFDKLVHFFKEFGNICKLSIDKSKQRKKDLLVKMYDKHLHSAYKYRYKLKWYDYVFVIIYIGMLIFYIWKVR